MRRRYASAGYEYKGKLIDEAVELFGYHRNAAIRALRRPDESKNVLLLTISRKHCSGTPGIVEEVACSASQWR